MTELSLNETARRHNVSKGGLSKAVHAERPIKGHGLYKFAIVENGKVKGFQFPKWYEFPQDEKGSEETVFMTFQELCEAHAPFHRGMIEEALRQGWPVDGYPINEWVVRDEEGAVEGFEVPRNADLDPERRNAANVMGKGAESGEKPASQGDGPNETALSRDDDPSDQEDDGENAADPVKTAVTLGGMTAVARWLAS